MKSKIIGITFEVLEEETIKIAEFLKNKCYEYNIIDVESHVIEVYDYMSLKELSDLYKFMNWKEN